MLSSTGPGSPDPERVGVNLQHLGEEIRSENDDSVVLATLAGFIAALRAESAGAAKQ